MQLQRLPGTPDEWVLKASFGAKASVTKRQLACSGFAAAAAAPIFIIGDVALYQSQGGG